MLLRIQKAPIGINKNGKSVAVMEQLRATWLKAEIQKGMDDIAAGNVVEGDTVFAALRKQVGVQNR